MTEAVYGKSARKFARRHVQAGGKAYRYVLTWGAPGNFFRAAHTVDLPLLFGDQRTWQGAGLLHGRHLGGSQRPGPGPPRRLGPVRLREGPGQRGRDPRRPQVPLGLSQAEDKLLAVPFDSPPAQLPGAGR